MPVGTLGGLLKAGLNSHSWHELRQTPVAALHTLGFMLLLKLLCMSGNMSKAWLNHVRYVTLPKYHSNFGIGTDNTMNFTLEK